MKDALENLGKIVGALSFFVLAMSFTYEFGFYAVVGRPFQMLMGATDYVTSAILWMPWTIVGCAVGAAISMIQKRPNVDEPAPLRSTRWSRFYQWLRGNKAMAFVAGTAYLGAAFEFFHENPYTAPALIFAIPMLGLNAAQIFVALLPKKIPIQFVIAIAIVAVVLPLNYTTGLRAGYRAVTGFTNVYEIGLKDEKATSNVLLLRALSGGVLVRDALKSRTIYYKWDNLTTVAKIATVPDTSPLSCVVFGWNCPEYVSAH